MTVSVTAADGRVIALRTLTALDKLRLFKAAGPILCRNEPWLGMALLACAVSAIDDIPVPMPADERGIEALVQRLGDAGLAAVATMMRPEPDRRELATSAKN